MIEKPFDIYVYDIIQVAPLHVFMNLGNRMFLTPVWPETIAVVVKFCLTDWLQNL